MRLITCTYLEQQYLGVVVGDTVILLTRAGSYWPNSMQALIEAGPELWSNLVRQLEQAPASARVPLAEVRLLAPIPRPRKNIMCLGLNYKEHAQESYAAHGREVRLPEAPVVFTKAVTSVIGPYDPIPYDPELSTELDWEVELAVVLGIGGRHISEQAALQHVFGYTVLNDITARNLQFRHKQYFIGKSLDGSCPLGPWIVTADEIADPHALDLYTRVNGEIKQSSNTGQQIFSIASVIATLSRAMTLEPGDIIGTGTPSGVGFARRPPEYLKPGDIVECEVEGIGRLRNPVVQSG
jgi:2-keto-4-pentenoate hydratase/2-oxohepta-3-ene-1,7-dioic acid hydratase in catechol pathway